MSAHPSPARRTARLGLVGATVAALTVTTFAVSSTTQAVEPATSKAKTSSAPDAPALFTPVAGRTTGLQEPQSILGDHRLVDIDPSAIPARVSGQRITLPLVGDGPATVRLTGSSSERSFTTWSGQLEGDFMSNFTLVETDGVYRGTLVSPTQGTFTLSESDGRYWWSDVETPKALTSPAPTSDALTGEALGDEAPGGSVGGSLGGSQDKAGDAGAATYERQQRRRKVKIRVLFGFTKRAKAAAGTRANLKAAAATVIEQTNFALKVSGAKRIKLRYAGLVKAKGKESNPLKDAVRLAKTRDRWFNNMHRPRKRKKADLMHLFTYGTIAKWCGGGMLPPRPRFANRRLGAAAVDLRCIPNLSATHEIGHNLGADHDKAAGGHGSRMPTSFGFTNVAGNYITTMSYYNACINSGIYTCVRIPWYSTPNRTAEGLPLASKKKHNNAKVIKATAPRVARYYR